MTETRARGPRVPGRMHRRKTRDINPVFDAMDVGVQAPLVLASSARVGEHHVRTMVLDQQCDRVGVVLAPVFHGMPAPSVMHRKSEPIVRAAVVLSMRKRRATARRPDFRGGAHRDGAALART